MNLKRGFGSDRQKFASMVTALDRSVQTVVNVLKAKNMWENTVFLFPNGKRTSNLIVVYKKDRPMCYTRNLSPAEMTLNLNCRQIFQ